MSSALTVNDTDSSHGESEIRDTEIIVNNATSRSQEVVFKESLAQNMKTNDSSNPPQFVNEKDTSMVNNTSSSLPEATVFEDANAGTKNSTVEPLCTFMGRSDFCEIKGDIRIDGSSYTVFIVSSEIDILAAENTSWCIRPYARKGDQAAMGAALQWRRTVSHNQRFDCVDFQVQNINESAV
ncbi:hypothetical protein OIU84_007959 [Salix udensis]|uniref:Uncharacterized protein n=1 Tax=Salix udensis TaxID=889485 RepID=A0AAD6P076_9ROSI|nr:hypothetical protein OIU84_007959 [Salix udensis]